MRSEPGHRAAVASWPLVGRVAEPGSLLPAQLEEAQRVAGDVVRQTPILQALQPPSDFSAVETHFPAGGSGQSFREDLRQGLPLQIHGAFAFDQPLCEGRKLPYVRRACVSEMNPDE